MTIDKKRDPVIVVTRVFAMTLVVVYHSLCLYADVWKSFFPDHTTAFLTVSLFINKIHLPIFTFASGILFQIGVKKGKYTNKIKFIQKKTKRLLLPYIIWGSFLIILFPQFFNLDSLLYGICHLWFLLMLFGIFMITIFTNKLWEDFSIFTKFFILIGSILLYETAKIIAYTYAISPYFRIWSSILYYLSSFLWGRLLYQSEVFTKCKLNFKYSITIISLSLFILFWLIQSQIPHKDIFILITYMPMLFSTLQVIKHVIKRTIPTYIYTLDNYCMGIYIFHHIIIWLLIINLPHLLFHESIGALFLFTTSFITSYILTKLFNKNKYLRPFIGN